MKTLICYKTRNGATEKYANWLAQDLKCDIKKFDEIGRRDSFDDYDTIIVSSGTYAGLMPLNRFLKRHWKNLEAKKVVVVAVGAAPVDDPWSIKSYNRIPEKIRGKIKYYKLMGELLNKDPDYVSPVKKENLKEVLSYLNTKN